MPLSKCGGLLKRLLTINAIYKVLLSILAWLTA